MTGCEICGISPDDATEPSRNWTQRHTLARVPMCGAAGQAARLYDARRRGDEVLCLFCCITAKQKWNGGTRHLSLHDKWGVPPCDHALESVANKKRSDASRVSEALLGSTVSATGQVVYHDTLTREQLLAARASR